MTVVVNTCILNKLISLYNVYLLRKCLLVPTKLHTPDLSFVRPSVWYFLRLVGSARFFELTEPEPDNGPYRSCIFSISRRQREGRSALRIGRLMFVLLYVTHGVVGRWFTSPSFPKNFLWSVTKTDNNESGSSQVIKFSSSKIAHSWLS